MTIPRVPSRFLLYSLQRNTLVRFVSFYPDRIGSLDTVSIRFTRTTTFWLASIAALPFLKRNIDSRSRWTICLGSFAQITRETIEFIDPPWNQVYHSCCRIDSICISRESVRKIWKLSNAMVASWKSQRYESNIWEFEFSYLYFKGIVPLIS